LVKRLDARFARFSGWEIALDREPLLNKVLVFKITGAAVCKGIELDRDKLLYYEVLVGKTTGAAAVATSHSSLHSRRTCYLSFTC
jgi:hypothetical protein